jgi:molecular chaperone GrpE
MPEPTPPGDAGGAAGRPAPGPLTPEAIDAALADFRRWLEDLAANGSEPPPEPEGPSVDLATLAGAFTALRHEVNLQTKATRAQSEQLARALEALNQQSIPTGDDDTARPLVKAVAEVYDTLALAARELTQLRSSVPRKPPTAAKPPTEPGPLPEPPQPRRSLWRRLWGRGRKQQEMPNARPQRSLIYHMFFGSPVAHMVELQDARQQQILAALGDLRSSSESDLEAFGQRLDAAVTGLLMGQRRVERLMREAGLEPVECVGRPFDPEAMEAVEAVEGGGRPPGTVVEELRRGYRWRGRVFRYAQVRVAK